MIGLGISAVIPRECQRDEALSRGKFESDFGLERVSLLVDAGRLRLNFDRVSELERAEGHIGGVAGHVAQCAGAEILPTAPGKGVIHGALSAPFLAGLLSFGPFAFE